MCPLQTYARRRWIRGRVDGPILIQDSSLAGSRSTRGEYPGRGDNYRQHGGADIQRAGPHDCGAKRQLKAI
jgi:hypothetical protein